ncbi:MAG: alpha/beta hydrolase family protein [Planctomycetota bacterium]|jgi:dienelactone hydrolase
MQKISENYELKPDSLNWLKEETIDGTTLKHFSIETARFSNGPVVTRGVCGTPEGEGPFPAILHIHGGTQTMDAAAVADWVRRGYAAMSFDWTGPKEGRLAENITSYPEIFEGELPLPVSQKQYLGYHAARYCLSILEKMENVDPDRIGIYGISWGGFLTWVVNGTDLRVKCAVPIYGTGGLHREGHIWNQDFSKYTSEEKSAWFRLMEPLTFAPQQNGKILHINAANDFFGSLDVAEELLAYNKDALVDFTANSNHHFSETGAEAIRQFFDMHLNSGKELPAAPEHKVVSSDLEKVVVGFENIKEGAELWYSYGETEHWLRCWRCIKVEPGTTEATLEVHGSLWFYVRQNYKDRGISLCSHPTCLYFPLREAEPSPLLWQAPSVDGLGLKMGTEMRHARDIHEKFDITENGLSVCEEGESFAGLFLRTPASPQSIAFKDKETLVLECDHAESIQVSCQYGTNPYAKDYISEEVRVDQQNVIELSPENFKDSEGEELKSFDPVRNLELKGVSPAGKKFTLKKIYWT